jgi:hypothetical protein
MRRKHRAHHRQTAGGAYDKRKCHPPASLLWLAQLVEVLYEICIRFQMQSIERDSMSQVHHTYDLPAVHPAWRAVPAQMWQGWAQSRCRRRRGSPVRYIVRNTRCTTGEVCRRSCKGNPDGRRSCPAGRCEGGVLGPRVQTATAGTSYTCTGTRPRLQHLNQDREWAHPALICSRTEAHPRLPTSAPGRTGLCPFTASAPGLGYSPAPQAHAAECALYEERLLTLLTERAVRPTPTLAMDRRWAM